MRGVNRIVLVGRVGRDPELKIGQKGTPWCSWSVATDRVTRVDEAWVEETDWHRVTAFGALAERCAERARRGALIAVEGCVTYGSWTDEDDITRPTTRVLADRVTVLAKARQIDVCEDIEAPVNASA